MNSFNLNVEELISYYLYSKITINPRKCQILEQIVEEKDYLLVAQEENLPVYQELFFYDRVLTIVCTSPHQPRYMEIQSEKQCIIQ